jgi:hypothetical protein
VAASFISVPGCEIPDNTCGVWFLVYGQWGETNRIPAADCQPWRPSGQVGWVDRPCMSFCQDSLVAAWYCSTTLAGIRPRSLTVMPWSFAQARISPLRWRFAADRGDRRG